TSWRRATTPTGPMSGKALAPRAAPLCPETVLTSICPRPTARSSRAAVAPRTRTPGAPGAPAAPAAQESADVAAPGNQLPGFLEVGWPVPAGCAGAVGLGAGTVVRAARRLMPPTVGASRPIS